MSIAQTKLLNDFFHDSKTFWSSWLNKLSKLLNIPCAAVQSILDLFNLDNFSKVSDNLLISSRCFLKRVFNFSSELEMEDKVSSISLLLDVLFLSVSSDTSPKRRERGVNTPNLSFSSLEKLSNFCELSKDSEEEKNKSFNFFPEESLILRGIK
ncbi:hypothetical protein [Mycoplasma suis]|uniref:hypothetical protein n=1 Tax=Mycoplasma suis TaxID=57372 RepID=UPI0005C69E98|nr:hypothetical protein [Mycoplasma suis]